MTLGPKQVIEYEDVTVAWICTSGKERLAACVHFDRDLSLPARRNGDTPYHVGSMCKRNVVVCLADPSDPVKATRTVQRLNDAFPNVELRLTVGTGSAVTLFEPDLRLGDVVVSASEEPSRRGLVIYDWGSPHRDGFQIRAHFADPPELLLQTANLVDENRNRRNYAQDLQLFLDRALEELQPAARRRPDPATDRLYCPQHPHHKPTCACNLCDPRTGLVRRAARSDLTPRVFQGVVASSSARVSSGKKRDNIARRIDQERGLRVLCFERGASSFHELFPSLVVKGISDYADAHGDPAWEQWAALAAAAYAKELLANILPDEEERAPDMMNDSSSIITPLSPLARTGPPSESTPSRQSSVSRSRRGSRTPVKICVQCDTSVLGNVYMSGYNAGYLCYKCAADHIRSPGETKTVQNMMPEIAEGLNLRLGNSRARSGSVDELTPPPRRGSGMSLRAPRDPRQLPRLATGAARPPGSRLSREVSLDDAIDPVAQPPGRTSVHASTSNSQERAAARLGPPMVSQKTRSRSSSNVSANRWPFGVPAVVLEDATGGESAARQYPSPDLTPTEFCELMRPRSPPQPLNANTGRARGDSFPRTRRSPVSEAPAKSAPAPAPAPLTQQQRSICSSRASLDPAPAPARPTALIRRDTSFADMAANNADTRTTIPIASPKKPQPRARPAADGQPDDARGAARRGRGSARGGRGARGRGSRAGESAREAHAENARGRGGDRGGMRAAPSPSTGRAALEVEDRTRAWVLEWD